MHGKIWCDQITVKDYHSLLSSGSAGALSVSLSSLDSSACCRISDPGFTGFDGKESCGSSRPSKVVFICRNMIASTISAVRVQRRLSTAIPASEKTHSEDVDVDEMHK